MKKIESFFRREGIRSPLCQILRIMQFSTVLILIATIHVSASVYSKNKRFDLNQKNNDKQVVLSPANTSSVTATTQQQKKKITGKVTDTNGEPIPGVSILVKGTTKGSITDFDGNYKLSTTSDDAILVFSFVGMRTQEISVSGKLTINLTMEEDAVGLDEVIAIGYGVQKKADLTGAISSVSSDDLSKTPSASVNQVLRGKAAGVQITQTSGQPGGNFSIRIRGTGSINANNEPLYIIDGMPIDNSGTMPNATGVRGVPSRNPLNSLPPSEIASIEILKDASSTAIYGSRAANGVIIITTKKGKEGRLKVNYSGSYGVQNVIKTPDLLDGTQFANTMNEISKWRGDDVIYNQSDIDAIPNNGKGTNWYEKVLNNNAPVQNHTLSLSGGNSKNRYLISVNNYNQKGILQSNGIKRSALRANLSHKSEKLDYDFNLNTSFTLDDFTPFGQSTNQNSGVFQNASVFTPMLGVYDEDGEYARHPTAFMAENPVALAHDYLDDGETNRTFGSFVINYEIIKNIKVGANMGFDRQFSRRSQYVPLSMREGRDKNGSASILTNERNSFNFEPKISYSETIDEIHRVQAMIGSTYQSFTTNSLGVGVSDFPSQAVSYYNLGAGAQKDFSSSYKSKNELLSYYGRLFYSLNDKYLATLTFRADGSSRFGESNKFAYFPAASVAWKLGEEDFIKGMDIFSLLKLRAGYGLTGNQEIGNYRSLQFFGFTNVAIGDQIYKGVVPSSSPGNPNLKWEKTGQFSLGLDFGFNNNKLVGNIDYYKRNTKDLLFSLPLATETGFSSMLGNVGEIMNEGFEFELTSINFDDRELYWETNFNISTNRNEVVSLNEGFTEQYRSSVSYGGGTNYSTQILRPGESLGTFYGYIHDGIWQTNEAAEAEVYGALPGDNKYRDINDDDEITVDDRTIIGNSDPKFISGLTNKFQYKDFDLSIFIMGVFDVDRYNATRFQQLNSNFFGDNWGTEILERWTPQNPSNTIDSKRKIQADYLHGSNTLYLEDASYIRLKNVTLGYNMPAKKLIKGISNLRVYCDVQNVFTITNFTGLDPEISSPIARNLYPLTRNFTFGIELGF